MPNESLFDAVAPAVRALPMPATEVTIRTGEAGDNAMELSTDTTPTETLDVFSLTGALQVDVCVSVFNVLLA